MVNEYVKKKQEMRNDPKRPPRPVVDPDCLRWTPLVASTNWLTDDVRLVYVSECLKSLPKDYTYQPI